jgi:hypothetical protein
LEELLGNWLCIDVSVNTATNPYLLFGLKDAGCRDADLQTLDFRIMLRPFSSDIEFNTATNPYLLIGLKDAGCRDADLQMLDFRIILY